jgi:hypothetical protein
MTMTLDQLFDRYRAKRLRFKSANTVRLYGHTIRSFARTLGHIPTVDDLTNDLVESHMSEILARGGSPASASTIGPHAVAYNTSGTYTATLTINGQSTNLTVVVAPDPGNPVFQITPFLTNFGYSQDTSLTTGAISIYYCGNQYGLYNSNNVQFQMTVGTYPANHQIIVNWGDGTSNVYAGTVGTVSHSYNCTSNNQFTASVSVVGPSGCVTAGTFEIYSGTAPQIFITNNLSTHCIPEPYDFTLNANDIPGTTYQYVFSDNNGDATPISGPFPVNLEYEFAIHSCTQSATIPGPGGAPLTYSNAYAASILATNLCEIGRAHV